MNTCRRLYFVLMLSAAMAFTTPVPAAQMTLTPKVRDHLAQLDPLADRAVDRSTFDGRPVLVKFFASW